MRNKMNGFFLICTLLFSSIGFAAKDMASLIRFDVEKYKLDNGLTVLLHEDHSAPIVSYHTWFRVGSRDEEPGYTGIAHLFEHMMFKGAKRYTGKQFDRLLQANGAVNNAFTSFDYTGYYENLPSDKIELIMDLESDRLVNLQVNEANLKSEREVVKEERRMRVDSSVFGKLTEALYATAFKVHPYKWPVIGYMRDLNRIDVKKSLEFYKGYYAPNNAVLVVAGAFDSSKVKSLINKYYAHLPASTTLVRKEIPKEPEQKAYRFQKIYMPVNSQTFVVAYPSTAAGDEDTYALDLLANILGEGNSSRLHRKLVYKGQMATSASTFNYTPKDPGLFQIFVSLKPGASFEKARKAVLGSVFKARSGEVKPEELQKAKNQIMKSYVDALKTIDGKAKTLALNETLFGDYEAFFKDLDKYNKVTAQDVLRVAKKYLTVDKANVVLVSPKKGGLQ